MKHGGRALNVFVLFVVNHQMLPTILREKLCNELSWVSLRFPFKAGKTFSKENEIQIPLQKTSSCSILFK